MWVVMSTDMREQKSVGLTVYYSAVLTVLTSEMILAAVLELHSVAQ